jgi:hypothetical protein
LPLGVPMNAAQPTTIRQRGADDLRPGQRVHVGVLVQHHAIEIEAAHPVEVVGAVEPDPSAVGQINPQLASLWLTPGIGAVYA